ncbi:hypothetical protein DFH01_10230 [Falsiroseomonas bella]|uniref:Anti-sigma factor NepR domain-containing protein n=1 Tax=Falsiroseomonas bella TaxID=2184016 RepID=A0A317FEC4_9PROT|nr:hypothetical protein [Falsiroseomonas bella]PWS37225.1 hypothetical protein DFH01_10230 [Falsiroseomonas bella]
MDEDENRQKQTENTAPAAAERPAGAESAFDVWLHDRLHQLYDSVTQEPVPPELAKLIEEDKRRRSK